MRPTPTALPSRTSLTLIALAVLATSSACGGGDDGGDDGAAPAPGGAGTSVATSTGAPTGTAETADTAETIAVSEAYCTAYAAVRNAEESTGGDFTKLAPLLQAAADEAPAGLSEDWADVTGAFDDYTSRIDAELLDPKNPPAGMSEDDAVSANLDLLGTLVDETITPIQSSLERLQAHGLEACPA